MSGTAQPPREIAHARKVIGLTIDELSRLRDAASNRGLTAAANDIQATINALKNAANVRLNPAYETGAPREAS